MLTPCNYRDILSLVSLIQSLKRPNSPIFISSQCCGGQYHNFEFNNPNNKDLISSEIENIQKPGHSYLYEAGSKMTYVQREKEMFSQNYLFVCNFCL